MLHHRSVPLAVGGHGSLRVSAAVRGFPGPAPGLVELLDVLAGVGADLSGTVADATGSAGGGVLGAARARSVVVLEPSHAALRAAQAGFGDDARVEARAGLPWDLEPGRYDTALLLPRTDRGNDRVRSELAAAAVALRPDGAAYAAMHKDQGARRYERDAGAWFERVSVVGRRRGWRVVRLEGPRAQTPTTLPDARGGEERGRTAAAPWRHFEALGREWWSLPGVHAARALDPGTALLLRTLEAQRADAQLRGASLADLGCGTGILAFAGARAGAAHVTALDDDLAAVRSARRNLPAEASVLHSDLDVGLEADVRLDVLLVNPPFHVGKQVRLDLARAFLETARARLRRGGSAWIVANRALPYEGDLAVWTGYETLGVDAGFKVLHAWV